jgi:3-deoxy-7-phosphoheptulonate synthase
MSTELTAQHQLNDLRITALRPLPSPDDFRATFPLGPMREQLVSNSRSEVSKVLRGDDDRLLVFVGPCSVHDPKAALEYAHNLARSAADHVDELVIVMRVYFEKPRTTVGWKGLINDPYLDGSHDIITGLQLARSVLLSILDAGVPIATEFLEPTSPQFIADAITWGAIGARNTESQVHRQLASGLSMPIGFKNGTDGSVQVAIDGCLTAANEHTFFGADGQGRAAAVHTTGNPDCHVILRGGRTGPNFDQEHVIDAITTARATVGLKAAARTGVVIDASHGNSGKDHRQQAVVVGELATRIAKGENDITGIMIESFLESGAQNPGPLETLKYGQSVTDECLDWDTTAKLLSDLADAVRQRRTS